ncbi:DUF6442 family protein [Enterococcus mundtii]|uniref:DUF6442 family protein n=1 Tax=Enterococcus mundtii TaxID=53346 RepID=UPI0023030EFE|nr:DUF6442 family protein [Enterococcus mundtii]
MNKEDILSKSRKENNNKDLFKLDVEKKSGQVSSTVLVILATILFISQSMIGGGFNFALYAVIVSYGAVDFFVKYWYIKKVRYIILSGVYFSGTIILIIFHLKQFINN